MSDRTHIVLHTITVATLLLSFSLTIIKGDAPWFLIAAQVATISVLALNVYLRRRWKADR